MAPPIGEGDLEAKVLNSGKVGSVGSKKIHLTQKMSQIVFFIEDYVREGGLCSRDAMRQELMAKFGAAATHQLIEDSIAYLVQMSVLDPKKLDAGTINANPDKIMPKSAYSASINPNDLITSIREIASQNVCPKSYVMEELARQYRVGVEEIKAPFETAISHMMTQGAIDDRLYVQMGTILLVEKRETKLYVSRAKIDEAFKKKGMTSPVPQIKKIPS